MAAVAQLALQNNAFQIAQCRAHIFETLPKANELVRDHLLGKAGVQKPRLEMLQIPAVEADLRDVMLVEYLPQMLRDVFVAHRRARRRLQVALIMPEVVGDAIHARLVVQAFAWQPERW